MHSRLHPFLIKQPLRRPDLLYKAHVKAYCPTYIHRGLNFRGKREENVNKHRFWMQGGEFLRRKGFHSGIEPLHVSGHGHFQQLTDRQT